jgi:hypothetical protein
MHRLLYLNIHVHHGAGGFSGTYHRNKSERVGGSGLGLKFGHTPATVTAIFVIFLSLFRRICD